MGEDLSGSGKWHGIALGSNGKLYAPPFAANDVLLIDPDAGTLSNRLVLDPRLGVL
jgi:hypothetical protein